MILVPFIVTFYHFLFLRYLFGFSWTSLFVRYFGSISRFEQYVWRVEKIKTMAHKWQGDSNIRTNIKELILN